MSLNHSRSAVVLFFLFQLMAAVSMATEERPNILFVIVDDLNMALGCYGDDAAETPGIDALADRGMRFQRAFVQGTVCTPSRTSFMLGLNNRSAGRRHFIENPETMTMGRFFRENGYFTFGVGKIDHTKEFGDPGAWDERIHPDKDSGFGAKLKTIREDDGEQRIASRFGVTEKEEQTRDYAIAEKAIEFFETQKEEAKPFFAVVGFHKPHQPTISSAQQFSLHSDVSKFSLFHEPAGMTPLTKGSLRFEPGLSLTEAQQRQAIRAYYASVTLMDSQVSRVIQSLDSNGLGKETLVVLTSDHGYHLGWRGQWAKHDLSDEVMRVPLIARWPGEIGEGSVSGAIVELIDLFPTFADAAEMNAPESLDGKSFLPILKGSVKEGKTAAFCDDGPKGRTVRTKRFRLTQRPDGAHELYDLKEDPREYFNIYSDPDSAKTVARLSGLLQETLGDLRSPKR